MQYDRSLPGKRSVSERLKDYKEFVDAFSPLHLQEQSARCMNCGVPFCHSGCPLGNVIPEFNDAVYREQWLEAYEILSSTNNFPEFTGRICPAPCESACVLGINQPAVTIEEIEKHIIEIAFERGFVRPRKPTLRTGKKVAVVGSGPAGLAAAAQLNYAGHTVTVFERDDRPGGLLRYGIPDFKLEKWVVERRIQLMEEEGVLFQCHTEVGHDVHVNTLLREFNAVVLAGGATIPRDLPVSGRSLKGVHFAMEFLKQQNKRVAGISFDDEPIIATGKKVVVIGGGDTGSDCIGTSNRQGAQEVMQLELLPQPPLERNAMMPWPGHPNLLKTTSSHEEGAVRMWSVLTKGFVADEDGVLHGIVIADISWEFKNGKPVQFHEVPGSERVIACDLVLLAMGFLHPQHEGMLQQLGVDLDERGNVHATEEKYQTSIAKVFTAGDMRRGQSLVVWAISEGRECARAVDTYLMGGSVLDCKDANYITGLL